MSLNLDAMAQEAVVRLNQETNRRVGQRMRRMRERWAGEQGLGLPRPVAQTAALQGALIETPALYVLRITEAVASLWEARRIWEKIPGLGYPIKTGRIGVSLETVRDIAADCHLMATDATENSPGERHAYRSLLAHCEQVLLVGPVDREDDTTLAGGA